jgi:hypothetical protein
MPDPGPRLAGAHREIMLTPEQQERIDGPLRRPQPRLMLTPEQASVEGQPHSLLLTPEADGFQGQRLFLTPEARSQAELMVQQVQQQRQAIAQQRATAFAQAQAQLKAQAQAQSEQAQSTAQTTVAGEASAPSGDFSGPPHRPRVPNRFPSAAALETSPDV